MPIIKKHQTLLDFAAQHTGSAEGIFDVAELNGIGITDDIAPGTELKVPVMIDGRPLQVVTFYLESGLDIAGTGVYDETETFEGIDYWIIEEDFVVS